MHKSFTGGNQMDISLKRQREKDIVKQMIRIYCRNKHQTQKNLCQDCRNLLDYTFSRIDACPHIKSKTFCSACTTPCYTPRMRQIIKRVMRHSGPRMLLYHPLVTARHVWVTLVALFGRRA
jgi:hypothetical protein